VPATPDATVLDVATGTAAVAIELARRTGCSVVGLDQSPEMLAVGTERVARAGLADRIRLVEGEAERLPFADGAFDALTSTYLLRYVDDAGATLRELARVVRGGGTIAGLDFGVPQRAAPRALWELHVRALLPLAGRVLSPAWHEVGRFLGASIRDFEARFPHRRRIELWHEAGVEDVRERRLTLGAGVVTWGRRR
jgi:demethylmenaquinone methyltransferase/2-methoxy-6-polyprenyl-1,4-benzoquinol methylase